MSELRTPSLRRRVTVMAVALVGVVLVVLVLVSNAVIGNRLESQLRQRLADRATVATALADQVDPRDLARRLEGDGVSVVVTTSSGQVYAEGPLGGAATQGGAQPSEGAQDPGDVPSPGPRPKPGGGPKAAVVQEGDRLSVTRTLSTGSRITLLADASDVHRTLEQVRIVLGVAAVVVLLAAAGLMPLVVRRALRPLEQMTGVARSITAGDRSRRLRPDRPGTELGRTAAAFDETLDAVVGAESRAVASEDRLRSFLSDAAHELRTPLAGVQAAAEHVLRDDPSRADREQVLLGLVRESRRAGRLVDDMLTMARIDQGLTLRTAEVDLAAVAAEVVAVRDSVALSAPVPVPVTGDHDRLVQVLSNVVDNARHVAAGVRVTVWTSDGTAGVDVTDDGPGVPPADRERIFERLVRLDEARTRHDGGAGLGLPIARGLARAHGGDLVLLDGVRRGATFRLTLPAGQSAT